MDSRASRQSHRNHLRLSDTRMFFRRLVHETLESRVLLSVSLETGTYYQLDGILDTLTQIRPGVYSPYKSSQPIVDLSALTLNIDARIPQIPNSFGRTAALISISRAQE